MHARSSSSRQRSRRGHVEKGEPSPDDLTATQVKYVFACSGPITGSRDWPPPATWGPAGATALDSAQAGC